MTEEENRNQDRLANCLAIVVLIAFMIFVWIVSPV